MQGKHWLLSNAKSTRGYSKGCITCWCFSAAGCNCSCKGYIIRATSVMAFGILGNGWISLGVCEWGTCCWKAACWIYKDCCWFRGHSWVHNGFSVLAYEINESSADEERKLSEKPGFLLIWLGMLCREVWGLDLGLWRGLWRTFAPGVEAVLPQPSEM